MVCPEPFCWDVPLFSFSSSSWELSESSSEDDEDDEDDDEDDEDDEDVLCYIDRPILK